MSLALVRQAEAAQAAVRSRVDAETWHAYWIVAIEDRPIREAAESLGKSYTAVYAGYKRVDRMLRAEGQRRLAALLDTNAKPESARPASSGSQGNVLYEHRIGRGAGRCSQSTLRTTFEAPRNAFDLHFTNAFSVPNHPDEGGFP